MAATVPQTGRGDGPDHPYGSYLQGRRKPQGALLCPWTHAMPETIYRNTSIISAAGKGSFVVRSITLTQSLAHHDFLPYWLTQRCAFRNVPTQFSVEGVHVPPSRPVASVRFDQTR